jgi:hypothetical protein
MLELKVIRLILNNLNRLPEERRVAVLEYITQAILTDSRSPAMPPMVDPRQLTIPEKLASDNNASA